MKELDIVEQLSDNVVDEQKMPVQKEYHLIGSMKLRKNQFLYSMNTKTFKIEIVKMDKRVGEIKKNGMIETKNKANHDPDCIYYPAYNLKQAITHFKKLTWKTQDQSNCNWIISQINKTNELKP